MPFKDAIGPTGLKMSTLRTKQKPSGKGGGKEFPSMEETNFFDPKSLGMTPARGSSLPRRKAAPLDMEFNSVPGVAAPKKKKPGLKSLGMKGLGKNGLNNDEIY